MSRRAAVVLLAVYAVVATAAVVASGDNPLNRASARHGRIVGYGQVLYRGAGPERWAYRYHRARAELAELRGRLREQRRELLSDPHVVEAINLACATYGFCAELWRKASCETGGTFDPNAENPSGATGLFQFLDSTWNSTPYARFPRTSAYASALAAGWMHEHGRGGEWSCR